MCLAFSKSPWLLTADSVLLLDNYESSLLLHKTDYCCGKRQISSCQAVSWGGFICDILKIISAVKAIQKNQNFLFVKVCFSEVKLAIKGSPTFKPHVKPTVSKSIYG